MRKKDTLALHPPESSLTNESELSPESRLQTTSMRKRRRVINIAEIQPNKKESTTSVVDKNYCAFSAQTANKYDNSGPQNGCLNTSGGSKGGVDAASP